MLRSTHQHNTETKGDSSSFSMSGRPNSRNTRFNVAQKPRTQINASPVQHTSSGFLPQMVQTKSFQDLHRNTPNVRNSLEHSNLQNGRNLNLQESGISKYSTTQSPISAIASNKSITSSNSNKLINSKSTNSLQLQSNYGNTNINGLLNNSSIPSNRFSNNNNLSNLQDSVNGSSDNHDKDPYTIYANNNSAKNQFGATNTMTYNNFTVKDALNQQNALSREAQLLQEQFKYVIQPSQYSTKQNGCVKAYAANTHHGLFRNYNQDRVSIILSISKPNNQKIQYWPQCSFFAVYDGHGGAACADFLRDNLHLFIIKQENFPVNPKEAIQRGFAQAEQTFINLAEQNMDRSGSCAVVALVLDDVVYIANVGDSRAVLSSNQGKLTTTLTNDHQPVQEKDRIVAAGGRIYQSNSGNMPLNFTFAGIKIVTPFRVFPGQLSVSRTFGDIQAKLIKYGGNPKVVIAEPQITVLKLQEDHDFIILSCDGIYDRLDSQESIEAVWRPILKFPERDIHKNCAQGIESLIRESFEKRTLDNVTVVIVGFENLEKYVEQLNRKGPKIQTDRSVQSGLNNENIKPPPSTQDRNHQVLAERRVIEDGTNSEVTSFQTLKQSNLNPLRKSANQQKKSSINNGTSVRAIKPIYDDPLDSLKYDKINNNNNSVNTMQNSSISGQINGGSVSVPPKFPDETLFNQNYYHQSIKGGASNENMKKSQSGIIENGPPGSRTSKHIRTPDTVATTTMLHSKSNQNLPTFNAVGNNQNIGLGTLNPSHSTSSLNYNQQINGSGLHINNPLNSSNGMKKTGSSFNQSIQQL